MIVSSFILNFYVSAPILVSSSDDDNENENPPLPTHLPLVGSIEHEPTLAIADLVGDPLY
jgi:hypothetical protein